jgi:hypothetical protein
MGVMGVANLIQGTVLREWVGDVARLILARSMHTCGCGHGEAKA